MRIVGCCLADPCRGTDMYILLYSLIHSSHVHSHAFSMSCQQPSDVSQRFVLQVLDVQLPEKLPRMTYAEAMDQYGCDKPDVRYDLHMCDVTDIVRDSTLR